MHGDTEVEGLIRKDEVEPARLLTLVGHVECQGTILARRPGSDDKGAALPQIRMGPDTLSS